MSKKKIGLLLSAALVLVTAALVYGKIGKPVFREIKPNIQLTRSTPKAEPKDFSVLWYSDFNGKRVVGLDPAGNKVWEQRMDVPPIPKSGYATHTEYVTVAPNGNLIVADGEGMMVQEVDRKTHELRWQYGVKDVQGYEKGYLHQPDKSFKINDHEVLINDGNNRRVIIVDQKTNDIVWQYGEDLKMGSKPGFLMAGTNTVPLKGGQEILITDTLQDKVFIVDRSTKAILWEYHRPQAQWLQHVFPTDDDTFVMEDRMTNEVFEVDRTGKVLWTINTLKNGQKLNHPNDAVKLQNGNVLIADAGRARIIEVNPQTSEIMREYNKLGLITTIAIDYNKP